MTDCLFCRIVNKEIPSRLVYEDEKVLAFEDIKPQAPAHILIIPKKHLASLKEADENDQNLLGYLLLTARKIAQDKGLAESGFRLVINSGPDSGQEVYHLHVHLLGGRRFGWPPG
ncbi:MAG TPA: histidine triad nucleotide-binding protein [Candidatus Saccharicenans sp.]|jgi:histidine triad (HIT) family protein|nr:histidine triad nucleotide-binding protein [Candidatus Saccharicenans sp.]HOJ26027.1 histidine triad nucleotide-binding protein [Candidatus Saccharicenans sp.]HOL45230.1 histidine triad nucleotide-binding protein [Candidatus Saccharicenans sp.]HOM93757.1 histidine triad nucleotide-binding protein [Candidatus Saccharicenans sp.]HOT68940.1 histidine triad nucleotide-binding protein [Candidatus Saccharicenans sp.]